MDDARVPMSAVLSAFGVEGTVTRPDDTPIPATVVWLPPLIEDVPTGMNSSRREVIRLMAFDRAQVPTAPRGTLIEAPELAGGEIKTWRVDGHDLHDAEQIRVVVMEVKDVET